MAKVRQTVPIGGKDVPITADGTPSLVYLNNNQKGIIREVKNRLKEQKRTLERQELEDVLARLNLN